MKDQFTTVLEALRLARAEFRTHDLRRVKNSPRTLQRLREVLFEDRVTQALRRLDRKTKHRASCRQGATGPTASASKSPLLLHVCFGE
jgi:hypothetical protein